MLSGVDDPERLRRLLDAVLAVGSDLSLPVVLRQIVASAVDLVDATYGALGVLDERRQGLAEFVHVGISDALVDAIGDLPAGHGILGTLIVEPRPLRLPDISRHPDTYGFPPNHPGMKSFLGVPITIRGQVYGNLYLTEKRGAAEFTPDDESLVIVLATAASLAVDNARLLGRVRELAMAEDRERIAADLHDTVIQRLFATGLALDASRRLASPELGVRLDQAVADLDETIKQIRSTIFALEAPRLPGRGLRSEVVALATEAAATLGFEPRIRLDGPLDSAVHREVGDDVLAALREGLSNVARHAHATAVDIEVSLGGNGELMVCVTDDGRGPVRIERAGGRGLANLARRAEAHGGSLELLPGPGGHGARLTWHVAKPGQPPADA